MITLIFQILASALQIWEDKEKTKYVDQLISLKEQYYEEINKPAASFNEAAIDDITFQLRILGLAFTASIATTNSSIQPGQSTT